MGGWRCELFVPNDLLADLIRPVKLPLTTSPRISHPSEHHTDPQEGQSNLTAIPKMIISPTSPPHASPFADPRPVNPPDAPRFSHASMDSTDSSLPKHSPNESSSLTYGYAGPSWRGGAGIQPGMARPDGGDKWWHALCAWGTDLDGDDDEQGGRTNPFE